MDKKFINLRNYLDLLVDERIDKTTNCPICINGVSDILYELNEEIKEHYKGKSIQRFLKDNSLYGIYHWKKDWFPIPINQLKNYLLLWKRVCKKSEHEYLELYDKIYCKADYFKARCSPVNVKIIRKIDKDLAYLLGVFFADGSLRNIWLTQKNEKRLRWEISITEEKKENLLAILSLLEKIFGIKTNVKEMYGGKWYRILFQSMILHRILNSVFEMPMGYKKGKLRVPQLIEKAPYEIKKEFLIGFFDGDGMCSNLKSKGKTYPVISVSQSSKEILTDLKDILEQDGIYFNLYTKRRNKYLWYVLETKNKKQITKFHHELNFRYENKKERLQKLIDSFKKEN